MATRQFFKDLTPGEIYWIKSQTTKIQVDGMNLSEPSYLRTLPDGTSPFDNFTPKQRANIFSVLDAPAVKTLTRQYDASRGGPGSFANVFSSSVNCRSGVAPGIDPSVPAVPFGLINLDLTYWPLTFMVIRATGGYLQCGIPTVYGILYLTCV